MGVLIDKGGMNRGRAWLAKIDCDGPSDASAILIAAEDSQKN